MPSDPTIPAISKACANLNRTSALARVKSRHKTKRICKEPDGLPWRVAVSTLHTHVTFSQIGRVANVIAGL
jgi:hypothetical protein